MARKTETKAAATTTVTRTVRVAFEYEHVHAILRRECGAPDDANVVVDMYDDSIVEWSTTETSPS